MSKNILMMAFSTGKASTEAGDIKRYVGVAPVKILSVCPTKAELEKIFPNASFEKEPEYISEKDGVKTARIEFIMQTDADKCNGIDTIVRGSIFIHKENRYNRDKTKILVMDKYGQTGWATKEQLANHDIMFTKNDGSTYNSHLDKGFAPCYAGMDQLIEFLKNYLNIPNVMNYNSNTKEWTLTEHPEECEASLSKVEALFNGDFSELKEIISYQPNNKIKVAVGVRTTDEGRTFQDVFMEMTLKNGVLDYSRLDAFIKERQNNGAHPNTVYSTKKLYEYKPEPTDFNEVEAPVEAPSWFN